MKPAADGWSIYRRVIKYGRPHAGMFFVGVLGANAITRHDAVASVQAGFADRELSALWPHAQADWRCHEYVAPPFTHVFSAVRRMHGGDRGGHA